MSVLMRELIGEICRCGRPKSTRNTFCNRCYMNLPLNMRKALYRRVGEGYEEAYENAANFLFPVNQRTLTFGGDA